MQVQLKFRIYVQGFKDKDHETIEWRCRL